MLILALYNIKGGVGKTASAVNLAYMASLDGKRTLLWDLDPQGAASYYFRLKTASSDRAGLEKKKELRLRIRGTDYDALDMVPADFAYRNLDLQLEHAKKPTQKLKSMLKPFVGEYDFVFLDCPPSISLASESVFAAVDALIVPTIPTTLSIRTLTQLQEHLEKEGLTPQVLPFFSMVDRRKKLHLDVCAEAAERFPILQAQIPYSSHVEQMGTHRQPVVRFAPRSPASLVYQELWQEIRDRLQT